MGCFLLPLSVALILQLFKKRLPKKLHASVFIIMSMGGSLALIVEHYAHGELVPWPPFFTAMGSPEDFAQLMSEIITIGTPMTLLLFVVWGTIVYAYNNSSLLYNYLNLEVQTEID